MIPTQKYQLVTTDITSSNSNLTVQYLDEFSINAKITSILNFIIAKDTGEIKSIKIKMVEAFSL